ncbi:hypothetical protein MUN77_12615 [Leucobacter allii]|uniref:hypothetical protein n=1 Tax=Leucobacter allii TaxID=2932247 RepID=UPI001FD1685E|nr:hypothetical protein [Leucobacter allii]UOR00977.1 hypothetical protein MUN77_12615 [Leucobacter allii]
MASEGFERFPLRGARAAAGGRRDSGLSRAGALVLGVCLGVGAILFAGRSAAAGETVQAWSGLIGGACLALLCIGVAPQAPPRARFRYLNQLVMTRAERPPLDSWVHLAPTRVPRPVLPVALGTAALALLGAAVFAALQLFGAVPRLNESAGADGLAIGAICCVLLGVGAGWVAWLMLMRGIRGGSYATRPSGVALGAAAVAVRVPGRDVELPWERIARVSVNLGAEGRGETPVIRLDLLPGDGSERTQLLAGAGYAVPVDALWYHAHPEARWELGRVEGQGRIDGWRADAIAARAGARNVR